jgi:hypothetical protein
MEILPYQTPATPPANVSTLIAAVQLPPADITAIKSVRAQLSKISDIDSKCKGDSTNQLRGEWRGFHHLRADQLLAELGDNPSIETAEAAHAAIVRASQAALSSDPISASLRTAAVRESLSLAPISSKVIDMALAALDQEAAAHREAMPENTVFAGDSVLAFERTLASLRSALEAERPEAARDPQFWLWSHGFGQEPQPAAPAPAPLPEVKAPKRGRVELSDVAAEMSADLH